MTNGYFLAVDAYSVSGWTRLTLPAGCRAFWLKPAADMYVSAGSVSAAGGTTYQIAADEVQVFGPFGVHGASPVLYVAGVSGEVSLRVLT